MNTDTPTPRTDEARRRLQQMYDAGKLDIAIENTFLDMALFEKELTAAYEEMDAIRIGTRFIDRDLKIVTEQRDRLAEALKEYREALSNGPENCSYKMYEAVDEFAEKALADVKGGSDE